MQLLALDIGGTSTRAALLDASGRCLGIGTGGPGNPLSTGEERAAQSHHDAVTEALAASGTEGATDVGVVLAALAGASKISELPGVLSALKERGNRASVVIDSDLLAMFYSSTYRAEGVLLVAGTGAVAARVADYRLDHIADGLGWLMGDHGSGWWIGRKCLHAAAADLDGRSSHTALTGQVLRHFGIAEPDPDADAESVSDLGARLVADSPVPRQSTLQQLVNTVYSRPPVSQAALAPMVFEAAAASDAVAHHILATAAKHLQRSLVMIHPDPFTADEHVVLGGSILSHESLISRSIQAAVKPAQVAVSSQGLVGAAVLALRAAHVRVDADMFARVQRSVIGRWQP